MRRREAEARAAAAAAVDRILAVPAPAERMRAYAELARALAEDGDAMPDGAEDRIARSLRRPGDHHQQHGREQTMTAWTEDRRRMALLFTLRPIVAAGCLAAAAAPFALAAWRWGWSVGEALAAFLAPGWPLAGAVAAGLSAAFLARAVQRADTTDGLAWPVLVSAGAGVLGVAMAVY